MDPAGILARIQPMAGTTNPEHLKAICSGCGIELTRAEWYELYRATLTDEGRVQLGNSVSGGVKK